MEIPGHVENGVVVLDDSVTLPEGAAVTVLCDSPPAAQKGRKKKRVQLPLVPSKRPGTLRLTGKRIAEIFEEEDLATLRKSGKPKDDVSS